MAVTVSVAPNIQLTFTYLLTLTNTVKALAQLNILETNRHTASKNKLETDT